MFKKPIVKMYFMSFFYRRFLTHLNLCRYMETFILTLLLMMKLNLGDIQKYLTLFKPFKTPLPQ
jgi:hypothetical protein